MGILVLERFIQNHGDATSISDFLMQFGSPARLAARYRRAIRPFVAYAIDPHADDIVACVPVALLRTMREPANYRDSGICSRGWVAAYAESCTEY